MVRTVDVHQYILSDFSWRETKGRESSRGMAMSQLLALRRAVQHLAIAEMSTAPTGHNPRKSEHLRGIANCLVLVLSRVASAPRSPARRGGIDEDRRKGWVW